MSTQIRAVGLPSKAIKKDSGGLKGADVINTGEPYRVCRRLFI
ncbi:hypothetical protein J559_2791 [Acinetobacter sp. 983759]|nr:hypothetical protein J520_2942 [Acinetobacter sp. 869535]EXE12987.1 hypothetical protein J559_2791 [Acinetobacter sp. 983759]